MLFAQRIVPATEIAAIGVQDHDLGVGIVDGAFPCDIEGVRLPGPVLPFLDQRQRLIEVVDQPVGPGGLAGCRIDPHNREMKMRMEDAGRS